MDRGNVLVVSRTGHLPGRDALASLLVGGRSRRAGTSSRPLGDLVCSPTRHGQAWSGATCALSIRILLWLETKDAGGCGRRRAGVVFRFADMAAVSVVIPTFN